MATYSVEEEYMQALRSKSYVNICALAHQQLGRTNSSSSFSSSEAQEEEEEEPAVLASHLRGLLVEPVQQEALLSSHGGHLRLRALLADYLDATLASTAACAAVLASVGRVRSHHRALRRLLLSLVRSPTAATFAELTALLELDNPLSAPRLSPFTRARALLAPLLSRLTSARRITLVGMSRRALGVAVAAVAGRRTAAWWVGEAWVETAARGAYIVARELDTVSRMVRRAEGEVEHGLGAGRMAARGRERRLVREVAREVDGGGAGLAEQLRELEEHVCFCLLTINRSRRLVAEEMAGGGAPPSST